MATPQQPPFLRAGVFNDGIDPQHASERERPPENGKHYRHRRDKPQRHGYEPADAKQPAYPDCIPGSHGRGELTLTRKPRVLVLFNVPQHNGHAETPLNDKAKYAGTGYPYGYDQHWKNSKFPHQ